MYPGATAAKCHFSLRKWHLSLTSKGHVNSGTGLANGVAQHNCAQVSPTHNSSALRSLARRQYEHWTPPDEHGDRFGAESGPSCQAPFPLIPPKPLKTKPQRPPPQLHIDSPHRVTLKTHKTKPQLFRAQAVSTSLHAFGLSQAVEKLVRAVGRGFIPGITQAKSTRAFSP